MDRIAIKILSAVIPYAVLWVSEMLVCQSKYRRGKWGKARRDGCMAICSAITLGSLISYLAVLFL